MNGYTRNLSNGPGALDERDFSHLILPEMHLHSMEVHIDPRPSSRVRFQQFK